MHGQQYIYPFLMCSILAGVEAAGKAAEYMLCLDDDIVLHPGTLAELVAGLATDDSCFMATGEGSNAELFHAELHMLTRTRQSAMAA